MANQTLPTFKPFDNFVCAGDTRSRHYKGCTITARIEFDQDTGNPGTEYDCYSPEDIAAWEKSDWCWCGVVVTVHHDEMNIELGGASLWACEANLNRDNTHLDEVANALAKDAWTEVLARAWGTFTALHARVQSDSKT